MTQRRLVYPWLATWVALMLAGCGAAATTQQPVGAVPLIPTAPARPQPTVAATNAVPTNVPTQVVPTVTAALTPTFTTYREPRGVFTIDVPTNWRTSSLPNGVGITSLAYNATVIFTLSFSWQPEQLGPTTQAGIVEELKTRLLSSYMAQDVQLTGSRDASDRYTLAGTAILNGTPTTIEITLEQTAGGTIVLQSWLVPTALWGDFQPVFKTSMQRSLIIDDQAIQALTP